MAILQGYTVKPFKPEDVGACVKVHVDTWKTTYRGLVSDKILDAMTYESDMNSFGANRLNPPEGQATFVAVSEVGQVVGFATSGPNLESDLEFEGELGAVYILREHQRRGIGTALVKEAVRHLIGLGHSSIIVWVLAKSPYRRFYEKLGGVPIREKRRSRRGEEHMGQAYGWRDIRSLL